MHSQKHVRTSGIFLIELILAIFFFSLASAVCVQIFVKSHLLSRASQRLSHAVNECCSIAEVLTGADSLDTANAQLEAVYPQALINYPSISVGYDAEFNPCSQENAVYQLTVNIKDTSDTLTDKGSEEFSTYEANLAFKEIESGAIIYSLTVSHHTAEEVQP